MPSRYRTRRILTNRERSYKTIFKDRGVRQIRHFGTPTLNHPTAKQIRQLNTINYIWKAGDRYFKLAHKHYNDSTLWWVIAWFNQKPTEADVDEGDTLQIPKPLDKVLTFMGI